MRGFSRCGTPQAWSPRPGTRNRVRIHSARAHGVAVWAATTSAIDQIGQSGHRGEILTVIAHIDDVPLTVAGSDRARRRISRAPAARLRSSSGSTVTSNVVGRERLLAPAVSLVRPRPPSDAPTGRRGSSSHAFLACTPASLDREEFDPAASSAARVLRAMSTAPGVSQCTRRASAVISTSSRHWR